MVQGDQRSAMDCPRCRTENRAGARFCVECGSGLALICPECGTKLPPGAKFCDACGAQVGALRPEPGEEHAPPALDGAIQRLIPKEYAERLQYYFDRIPYKFTRMRYASFTRYFGHLKRLGWVEETGETEPSAIQDSYPPGPPRVYYRLTDAGRGATPAEISNPVRTLYPEFSLEYFREKRQGHRYYTKPK